MEKLDKILKQAVNKKSCSKTLKGAEICFYTDKWGNGCFKTISFANGILKLSVKSSPAASDLKMKEDELLDFLNSKIGTKAVRAIRIIVCR